MGGERVFRTIWTLGASGTCGRFYEDLRAASRVTGYSGWVMLRIHEENVRALISSHVPAKDGKANYEPASPVKVGREWHTLMYRLASFTLRKQTHQLQQSSSAEVRTYRITLPPQNLDICGCPDLSDTPVFAVPSVGPTGRYKPDRSESSGV
ncbi:hypothetical protein J6590_079247 [Homalodisca vitripennis]|nr:hypothetical protein J6590_079247 [Homalodisca vitripennis]